VDANALHLLILWPSDESIMENDANIVFYLRLCRWDLRVGEAGNVELDSDSSRGLSPANRDSCHFFPSTKGREDGLVCGRTINRAPSNL
jgi:hypothetical protein